MRILVTNNMVPFVRGGAEELADNLVRHLQAAGHEAELIRLPFRWEPFTVLPIQIKMAKQMWLDWADKVISLKFPAYLAPHSDTVIWLLHQYRQAYDLYDAGHSNIPDTPNGKSVRTAIRDADCVAFSQARRIFTNSPVTSGRLLKYNGITSEVLYPPLNDPQLFSGGKADGYLFAGGRVNGMKRQELLIRALSLADPSVRLVIAGPPDQPEAATALTRLAEDLGVANRVRLDLRFLSRDEIARFVNHSTACIYIPFEEDSLGYVAMEAAEASKAVITTNDSGGILGLVPDANFGWVTEPDPAALADAMSEAYSKPKWAKGRGSSLHSRWRSFNADWDSTIARLLS